MSWRLEERDLKGEWALREAEFEVLTQLCARSLKDPKSDLELQLGELIRRTLERADVTQKRETDVDGIRGCVQRLGGWILEIGSDWYQRVQTATLSAGLGVSSGVQGGLSRRLKAVADLCPLGWGLVDIGTDHALLPIAMIQSGQTPVAVGVDIASKPLIIAERHLESADLHGQLALICGDGVSPLIRSATETKWVASWNAASTQLWNDAREARHVVVTICGVGGHVAAQKIAELPAWVSAVVVQANNDPYAVDQALADFLNDSARVTDETEPRNQVCRGQWELLNHHHVDLSVTLERHRLFITKSALRGQTSSSLGADPSSSSDLHSSNPKLGYIAHSNGVARDVWLWYWVQLSRHLKVLTLTPSDHPSRSWKSAHVIDILMLWLALYNDEFKSR